MPKKNLRTNQQNKALHLLLNKHGFTSDDKAEMVFDLTNGRTEHSSEMSFDEANAMIERLGGTPFRSRQKRQTQYFPKNVIALVSTQAKEKIVELRNQRPLLAGVEAWHRFCQRTCGKTEPRTVKDGQKIIEALKAMNKRDAETAKEAA